MATQTYCATDTDRHLPSGPHASRPGFSAPSRDFDGHEAFRVSQAPGQPRASTLEPKGSCSWGARWRTTPWVEGVGGWSTNPFQGHHYLPHGNWTVRALSDDAHGPEGCQGRRPGPGRVKQHYSRSWTFERSEPAPAPRDPATAPAARRSARSPAHRHSRAEASRAPSTSASNFAHMMVGCWRWKSAPWAKPQSAPAMTRSRPTRRA